MSAHHMGLDTVALNDFCPTICPSICRGEQITDPGIQGMVHQAVNGINLYLSLSVKQLFSFGISVLT